MKRDQWPTEPGEIKNNTLLHFALKDLKVAAIGQSLFYSTTTIATKTTNVIQPITSRQN